MGECIRRSGRSTGSSESWRGPSWSNQEGTSRLTSSLMDMDGDGLVDIAVSNAAYYYKNVSRGNEIKFEKRRIGIAAGGNTSEDTSDEKAKETYHGVYYIQRPFRAWKAPYSGAVEVSQSVKNSGTGEVTAGMYADSAGTPGVSIRVRGAESAGRSDRVSVNANGRLYYIHDVKGPEDDKRDIKGNDIEWNIGIAYTLIRPFRGTEELIQYAPPERLEVSEYNGTDETVQAGLDELYIYYSRDPDTGIADSPVYKLRGWSAAEGLLKETGRPRIRAVRKWLYGKGYYIPKVIAKSTFEVLYYSGVIRYENEASFSSYYIYDAVRKEYRAANRQSVKSEVDQIRAALSSTQKESIVKGVKEEGFSASEEGGELIYAVSGAGILNGERSRGSEGSVYERGSYIALGSHEGQAVYVDNGIHYIGETTSGYPVEVTEEDEFVEVKVTQRKEGRKEGEITWRFSGYAGQAEKIEKKEMEELWRDELFAPLFTPARSVYRIENSYWTKRSAREMKALFDEYEAQGLISEAERADFTGVNFDYEAATYKRKTLTPEQNSAANQILVKMAGENPLFPCVIETPYWAEVSETAAESIFSAYLPGEGGQITEAEKDTFFNEYFSYEEAAYLINSDLSEEAKEEANELLGRIEREYFFTIAFPCYEEKDGWYELKEAYKEAGNEYEAYLKKILETYKLKKYLHVSKTIRYDSECVYSVTGGRYSYPALGSDGLSVIQKESAAKLEWDSGSDYSRENEAEPKRLQTGSRTLTINSDDLLYGGVKNWYYGMWAGDEDVNAFSEGALMKQLEAGELYAEEMKKNDMNEEERNAYMEAKGKEAEEEAEEKEAASFSLVYTLPQKYEDINEDYDGKMGELEGESRQEITGALLGEVSIESEQIVSWENGERKIETEITTYFPFIKGDYIHTNRVGGLAYYSLPAVKGIEEVIGIGYLRKSTNESKDKGATFSAVVVNANTGTNVGEGSMVRNFQDLNGDGIADLVYIEGGRMKVRYGSRSEDGLENGIIKEKVTYGEAHILSGGGSVLSLTENDITTSGVGFSAGPSIIPTRDEKSGKITGLSVPGNPGLSGGTTSAEGSNSQKTGMLDINGDGISDYIINGTARLGTGDGYTSYTISGLPSLISESTVKTEGSNFGIGIGDGRSTTTAAVTAGVSVGVNTSSSKSFNTSMFLDINGDGLPDRVEKGEGNTLKVRYNTGAGFTEEKRIAMPTWKSVLPSSIGSASDVVLDQGSLMSMPVIGGQYGRNVQSFTAALGDFLEAHANEMDYSATTTIGINGGVNSGGTVSIKVWVISINISANANAGVNGSTGTTNVTVKMLDINGDGYVDQVLRIPSIGTYVKLNLGPRPGS
ncbi:hypothetical protein K7I13_08510 [Brucepastera parasyntrophica]|uniref:hypothetical protein n=1 Tax=Brucepastera parasyntrophica TaxID=2880008 RepID=UPI00210C4F9F|nr:hypothetical protein [Brucepastera parasyntrophica]ULQ58607.1 hypothetical protein K7I13_08510 [Brucepastera parasyntrophica]